jgi:hypothetical protein
VLLIGSFVAYGLLFYGQYRDQYAKNLGFAQSSHRLLTEVMARRINGAIQKSDTREINRTLLDTVQATEIAARRDATAQPGSAPMARSSRPITRRGASTSRSRCWPSWHARP